MVYWKLIFKGSTTGRFGFKFQRLKTVAKSFDVERPRSVQTVHNNQRFDVNVYRRFSAGFIINVETCIILNLG
jgi:hypothetical protein